MPTILSVYLSKESLDEDLMRTLTHITEQQNSISDLDSPIDEGTPKIIFKIKKYYVIYI